MNSGPECTPIFISYTVKYSVWYTNSKLQKNFSLVQNLSKVHYNFTPLYFINEGFQEKKSNPTRNKLIKQQNEARNKTIKFICSILSKASFCFWTAFCFATLFSWLLKYKCAILYLLSKKTQTWPSRITSTFQKVKHLESLCNEDWYTYAIIKFLYIHEMWPMKKYVRLCRVLATYFRDLEWTYKTNLYHTVVHTEM
jgi:hypothetical protein